jgi:hypothetical protein
MPRQSGPRCGAIQATIGSPEPLRTASRWRQAHQIERPRAQPVEAARGAPPGGPAGGGGGRRVAEELDVGADARDQAKSDAARDRAAHRRHAPQRDGREDRLAGFAANVDPSPSQANAVSVRIPDDPYRLRRSPRLRSRCRRIAGSGRAIRAVGRSVDDERVQGQHAAVRHDAKGIDLDRGDVCAPGDEPRKRLDHARQRALVDAGGARGSPDSVRHRQARRP